MSAPNGWKPIHAACYNEFEKIIHILVENKARLNDPCGDIRNYSPLHILVSTKDIPVDLVEYLIDNGCNLNAVSDTGQTPLHLAVFWDHFPAVKLLVERKSNLQAKNEQGRRPLEVAAFYGYKRIAEYLAEKMGVSVPILESHSRNTTTMMEAEQPPPPSTD